MNTSTGYHKPQDLDAPYDDDRHSDSDLELNELDPQTTTAAAARSPSRQLSSGRISSDFGARIPLRNLRLGGRRRPREEDVEDLQALVGEDRDEEEGRSGLLNSGEHNDTHINGHASRFPQVVLSSYGKSQSRSKGIWRFMPFAQRTASIALPATDEDEPEDDHDPSATRNIAVGQRQPTRFPPNAVSHAKYTPWSFLPRTLYNEFKFFFNMYFLLVALSQIIPALRIGYLSTYIAPLAFVVSITLGKEAYDDVYRRKRDNEANSEPYKVLRFDEVGATTNGGGFLNMKKKVASMSEKKKGKRRKVSVDDEAARLQQIEDEEDSTEAIATPSTNVVEITKPSRDLKVGDVLVLGKDQRVPADVIILKSFALENTVHDLGTSFAESELTNMGGNAATPSSHSQGEASQDQELDNETTTADPSGGGEAFIRTDQLDGETDWKLRLATPLAQSLPASEYVRLRVTASKPDKKVNDFVGNIELAPKGRTAYDPPLGDGQSLEGGDRSQSGPLTIDNTAWANTVLASSTTVHAVVIYTGSQTRAALSTAPSRSKTGLLEFEINSLTKILCFLTAALSLVLVGLEGFEKKRGGHPWYVAAMRFLILFSTIVPISLRVNLDLGKSVYAWFIHRDEGIPGTVVRTSTIPEDLGRIEYLLSDKTGTLTRNEMELKKVHVGTVSYGGEAMEEVSSYVKQAFTLHEGADKDALFIPSSGFNSLGGATRTRREIGLRVRDLVLALALCHNVTPTIEDDDGQSKISYQASSPDEIAIVQWTEHVGLRLAHRDRKRISLQFAGDERIVVKVEILNIFPFTSDSKRMGIIVRFVRSSKLSTDADGEIVFFQKGADTVMSSIVAANDWLDEETGNMAREGLRTLVIGRKNLSSQQYAAFSSAYAEASLSLTGRDSVMSGVVRQHLERDLELLGVTGVEDKLQPHVKPSLELLRNAGIKIWMLTGDKVETARCVAVSSKLVTRGQYIHTIAGLKRGGALDALSVLASRPNAALLIDGQSLALYLQHHQEVFITQAVRLPAVIACRCSPTQKADVALLIRAVTKKRVACIGDGGNDVSMIQAADVGVGIVGKEGRQASLAADFSITQFAHLTKLLVWHGRNSYRRSAKLAQFVMHRGLIISVCQAIFSIASEFEPVALYRDWLLVGYATIYTMMPVFSLVLDKDVDEGLANLYPELYKDLTSGKSLSYRTFFIWVAISIYQGVIIQGGSELLIPGFSLNPQFDPTTGADITLTTQGFKRMVAVSYSVLIVNEIAMVAVEITTWHPIMIASCLATALLYFGSIPFLGGYFDQGFIISLGFWWRFAGIAVASLGPVYGGKILRRTIKPPSYRKVRGV